MTLLWYFSAVTNCPQLWRHSFYNTADRKLVEQHPKHDISTSVPQQGALRDQDSATVNQEVNGSIPPRAFNIEER